MALVMNGDILEVRSILKTEGEAEERVGGVVTSLAMSLILDMIRNMITDTILNVLGITTTTTPAPCGLGSGLIGINNQIRSDTILNYKRLCPCVCL